MLNVVMERCVQFKSYVKVIEYEKVPLDIPDWTQKHRIGLGFSAEFNPCKKSKTPFYARK